MSSVSASNRIPVAPAVRWQQLRLHLAPVLCFTVAIVVLAALWRENVSEVRFAGQVDAHRLVVTSPTAGLVTRLPHHTRLQWNQFDSIEAGDVIAQLDDATYQAKYEQFLIEASDYKSDLDAWHRSVTGDGGLDDEAVSQVDSMKQRELAYVDNAMQLATDTLDSPHSMAPLERDSPANPLAGIGAATHASDLIRLRQVRRDLQNEAVALQELRSQLEVRAPISGTLIDVHCSPGQHLHAGTPVATIAADHGRFIIGWLPDSTPVKPEIGDDILVRVPSTTAKPFIAQVEAVGGQLVPIPARQQSAGTPSQWGVPIRIAMPVDCNYRPGTFLEIGYRQPASDVAAVDNPTQDRELQVR